MDFSKIWTQDDYRMGKFHQKSPLAMSIIGMVYILA